MWWAERVLCPAVAIVAQALGDESWAGGGIRSPEHWLSLRAGLSPFRARMIVAVARRSAELPSVMDQFAAGQLSLDQVAVVARYAPAHVQASVAELAVHASVPQLRRALSRYCFDPPAQTRQHEQDPQAATGDPGAGDTAAGGTAAGDAGAGDTAAGDAAAGDAGTWNGFALPDERGTAPAQLSMSSDDQGRFTLRFAAPADLARWSRPR